MCAPGLLTMLTGTSLFNKNKKKSSNPSAPVTETPEADPDEPTNGLRKLAVPTPVGQVPKVVNTGVKY